MELVPRAVGPGTGHARALPVPRVIQDHEEDIGVSQSLEPNRTLSLSGATRAVDQNHLVPAITMSLEPSNHLVFQRERCTPS